MATASPSRRPWRQRRWLWISLIGIVVVACIAIAVAASRAQPATGLPLGWTTEAVENGAIDASISATGNIAAQAEAELRFSTDGTVSEILVRPGDQVRAGQALARLDALDAELSLTQAQANLAEARAAYEDLIDGPTPSERQEAEARVAEARARLDQALASVSPDDIAAARARLDQARARLAQLQAGPRAPELREAEASLHQAETALQQQRDQLSANKTNAEQALQQAVADLTRSQSAYSTARQNWEYVRETGRDPNNPNTTDPSNPARRVPNLLNDAQRQQYYDAFIQAEAALRAAESRVAQAQTSFDAARQAEESGVRTAELQLTSAQAGYDRVTAGADRDQLAEARAAVAAATADLNRLTGADRDGSIAIAQAGVEVAEAALARITGSPATIELARAEAALIRAETAVRQAQRTLEQATLTAPFAATVALVDLRVGERAGTTGRIVIVDMGGFYVDVPVDELDIAQIRIGQPATIALDALLDSNLNGTVTTIAPLADRSERGTNTYAVTVVIEAASAEVRPGMTATVQIVTQRKESVVLAPRRAIRTENGQTYVLIPAASGGAAPALGAMPGTEPGERRPVVTGLSNSRQVEIISGLAAGDQVYVPDIVQTFNPTIQ
ncbi:MAG TPA: HlyD family efflux transporter periplasmic adaptor subunit [Roseiflexaceae bacterium]|nr:HlyD family efflux transporter periplasmic adaptor subunit [Roseiflexaceae bacterium]